MRLSEKIRQERRALRGRAMVFKIQLKQGGTRGHYGADEEQKKQFWNYMRREERDIIAEANRLGLSLKEFKHI